MPPSLAERYKTIQERIATACAKARRPVGEVTLVGVTKTASPEAIKQVIELGQVQLGESRVQQLVQRAAQIGEWLARQQKAGTPGKTGKRLPAPQEITWHMIGHLQRNKVKQVLGVSRIIHSVDSLRLAEEIQAAGVKLDKPVQVFLEVNVAAEASKFGVAVGAALHLAEQIDTMEGVQLVGLMTMAPNAENAEAARPYFARLRELFEEIRFAKIGGTGFRHLSMGMSGDYTVAIEEGATMVRVGTALFG